MSCCVRTWRLLLPPAVAAAAAPATTPAAASPVAVAASPPAAAPPAAASAAPGPQPGGQCSCSKRKAGFGSVGVGWLPARRVQRLRCRRAAQLDAGTVPTSVWQGACLALAVDGRRLVGHTANAPVLDAPQAADPEQRSGVGAKEPEPPCHSINSTGVHLETFRRSQALRPRALVKTCTRQGLTRGS